MRIYKAIILIILAISITLIGCGEHARKDVDLSQRKINIITTTGMIADAVENIGGERVNVTALMGPGVDPHLYKASAGDVDKMSNTDAIFYNGLHLEGAMTEVFEKMKSRVKTYAVADGINHEKLIIPENAKGTHDPHIWFDVSIWMDVTGYIRDKLIELDPQHQDIYSANTDLYLDDLNKLHGYAKIQSESVPEKQRILITAHDAFKYFGQAYGFDVRGLQGISTASEAGTADVQQLASFIANNKIPAVFVESSVPKRNIEAVQAAVKAKGFKVAIGGELFSDAMGSAGAPEGTYIGMVRHNVDTITKSLKAK